MANTTFLLLATVNTELATNTFGPNIDQYKAYKYKPNRPLQRYILTNLMHQNVFKRNIGFSLLLFNLQNC